MRGRMIAAAALALLPGTAWSQLAHPRAIAMLRSDATWTPVAFVCDSTDTNRIVALSPPDGTRGATLTSLSKPGLARSQVQVHVGAADAGMNQRWYPLTDANGRAIGHIHTVNPAMVEPGATTPTVTAVTLGDRTSNCRFAPQTRILAATPKRSIQITRDDGGGYRYRSYDHDADLAPVEVPWGGRDTRASLTIAGGRLVEQGDGWRGYDFANRGYVYRVRVSVDPAHGGGGVKVWRGGRMVLDEPFAAYVAAL